MKTIKHILALSLAICMLTALVICSGAVIAVSAAPSYWGFDDYETVVYPGAPEVITSYPTTIKKVSNSAYTMSSVIEGVGTISISLIEETWGTFNLGNWILKDTNGRSHVFVDSSTDLEYVHEYYYSNTHVTYSGGNHGGEALESLKFFDGVTGNEINLSVGETHTSNVIHCVQKTKLLHFPDQNPKDSINDYINKNTAYTEDQVYAKLTRKYTFTGPQIKLNVDYLYTKETYHGKIYTCMFPIDKDYGLYCDMIDKDGKKIKTITTLEVGKADYSGPMNSGNAATRAVIYSAKNPKYQFDIRVNTLKDGMNNQTNSFKTAFWDMNTTNNKLYFSRYDSNNKILHSVGTEVHTEAIWLFRYSADGSLPAYAEEKEPPISLNKTYTNTASNEAQGDGVNTKYGALLTDGVASGDFAYNNDSWYLLFNGRNAKDGVGTIIIDLGASSEITSLRAHLANVSDASVKAPTAITVSGSDDGESYNAIANLSVTDDADAIYWAEATAPAGTKARYIKFEFKLNGAFAYLNELEVYGEEIEVEHKTLPEWKSDANKHWHECSCGDVVDAASHDEGVWVTTEENKKELRCTVCDYLLDTAVIEVISLGDVNASGDIDSMDYVLVKRAYFGTFELTDDQLKAADVNDSGDIDSMDYVLIKRAYFGTFSFQ